MMFSKHTVITLAVTMMSMFGISYCCNECNYIIELPVICETIESYKERTFEIERITDRHFYELQDYYVQLIEKIKHFRILEIVYPVLPDHDETETDLMLKILALGSCSYGLQIAIILYQHSRILEIKNNDQLRGLAVEALDNTTNPIIQEIEYLGQILSRSTSEGRIQDIFMNTYYGNQWPSNFKRDNVHGYGEGHMDVEHRPTFGEYPESGAGHTDEENHHTLGEHTEGGAGHMDEENRHTLGVHTEGGAGNLRKLAFDFGQKIELESFYQKTGEMHPGDRTKKQIQKELLEHFKMEHSDTNGAYEDFIDEDESSYEHSRELQAIRERGQAQMQLEQMGEGHMDVEHRPTFGEYPESGAGHMDEENRHTLGEHTEGGPVLKMHGFKHFFKEEHVRHCEKSELYNQNIHYATYLKYKEQIKPKKRKNSSWLTDLKKPDPIRGEMYLSYVARALRSGVIPLPPHLISQYYGFKLLSKFQVWPEHPGAFLMSYLFHCNVGETQHFHFNEDKDNFEESHETYMNREYEALRSVKHSHERGNIQYERHDQ